MKASKPVRGCFLASILFCLLCFTQTANATGQEAPFRIIAWEELLAVEYRESATAVSPANEAEMTVYLKRRENAPANSLLHGQNVTISGFVVPLERNEDFALREFLLVPFFGACIHVPPPPQNQIIHVVLDSPANNVQSMENVVVSGMLELQARTSDMGNAAYVMQATTLVKSSPVSLWQTLLALGLTLLCGLAVCIGWLGPFAGMRLSPTFVGPGIGFAAGIMACLGVLAVGDISLQHFGFFVFGAAVVALVHWLSHERHGHDGVCQVPSGLGTSLAIAMHNIPECFIVLSTSMVDTGLGLVLAGAMIAHNLPLGISLGLASAGAGQMQRGRAVRWLYAALAGVLPPLVAVFGFFYLRSFFSQEAVRSFFACAGGALVFIALKELLPFACTFGKRPGILAAFVTGAVFLYSLLLLFYAN